MEHSVFHKSIKFFIISQLELRTFTRFAVECLKDGFCRQHAALHGEVGALHLGHVEEARRASDHAPTRECQVRNTLANSEHDVCVNMFMVIKHSTIATWAIVFKSEES